MNGDWRALSREQLAWAYDQRQHAPNMVEVLSRLAQAGQVAQTRLKTRVRLPYGERPSEALDWYPCGKASAPLLFFVHGGAWRGGRACDYAFFVEWLLQAGIDVVIPDFDAVQDVAGDLQVLQRQLSQALQRVVEHLGSPPQALHLCGHSSGAHLAACLAVTQADCTRLQSLTLCSGIYDLEPVSHSARSQYVSFSPAVIEELSPIRHAQRLRLPTTLAYGSLESPEFIRQAQAFHAELSRLGKACRLVQGEQLNHFDILASLQAPSGLLARLVQQALGLASDPV